MSVILVLVAEIVIKLQREMDAKIGLDINYHGGGDIYANILKA